MYIEEIILQEMLVIHNAEILDSIKLNVVYKKTKKKQIFLFDSGRRAHDYFMKIKYRRNGEYEDVPHFLVTKLGIIYKLFDTKYYSKTFEDNNINKKQIKICLENLGWLNKNTITGVMYNWIGDKYRGEPFLHERKGHYYWDNYTQEQLNSLTKLVKFLSAQHNIPLNTPDNQDSLINFTNFQGILCKSNFQNIYKDINHSLNFNIFNE